MTSDNIVSKILDIPKIVPTDWNVWWDIWNNNAKPLIKYQPNHNKSGNWIGFDCYRADSYNPSINGYYRSELVDCSNVLPDLVETIKPIFSELLLVRVVQSTSVFLPHTDFKDQYHIGVRTLLYDDNPGNTFYYVINGERVHQRLPPNSNTWIYKDKIVQHGSEFDNRYKKILITYYGFINFERINTICNSPLYDEYSAKI